MRKLLVYGTMALGITGLAPVPSIADDKANDLGIPIHSLRDVQETAKIVFKLADTNNDGQISQKESTDVGNLLVGGFFFRADTNGDGVMSPEEARQARESLFNQQPLLRFIVERAKPTNLPQANQAGETPNDATRVAQKLATDPAGTIGNLLDTNRDQKLEAAELRQGVQCGVQGLFLLADTNQDGQLSPYELNAAVGEVARSAVQSAFQAADMDRNGALSTDEYDKVLKEPANALFRVIDANGDNQLSYEEIQRAEQILADQIRRLRVPDPPNSLSNQIGSPRTPNASTVAPAQPPGAVPAPAPRP
jgi:Ca2+-binding EF-hand superfamily protein